MKSSLQTESCNPERRDSLAVKVFDIRTLYIAKFGEGKVSIFFPELIASRASAWTHIASRKHVIHKVYTGSIDSVGSDVMMRGNLDVVLKNGMTLEMEFAARMLVDGPASAEPKVVLCQVWAVWLLSCSDPA
jgi:hypothetical protein